MNKTINGKDIYITEPLQTLQDAADYLAAYYGEAFERLTAYQQMQLEIKFADMLTRSYAAARLSKQQQQIIE